MALTLTIVQHNLISKSWLIAQSAATRKYGIEPLLGTVPQLLSTHRLRLESDIDHAPQDCQEICGTNDRTDGAGHPLSLWWRNGGR